MSSFDKTAGKNLDEILASIRKTLADESSPPQTNPALPTAATDPSTPAPANQNGGNAAKADIDEDVADLLAGGLGGAAPQTEPMAPAEAGDPKDPLWFLRPNGGREQVVAPGGDEPVSPAGDALAGPAVSPERPSLAALFVADKGSGRDDVDAAANGLLAPSLQAEAKSVPEGGAIDRKASDLAPGGPVGPPGTAAPGASEPSPPPQVVPAAVAVAKTPPEGRASSKPDLAALGGAAVARAPGSPGAHAGAVPGKPAATPAVSPRSADAERSEPVAAMPVRVQGIGAAPVVHNSAPVRPNALNGAARATTAAPSAADAVSAAVVPAGPTQALEQIIEQLLEPLLRRWVEANLPRLVDAAIRAEVARALEARGAHGQDVDPKL
jgi:cell pole-organizing protein PopZ